MCFARPALAVAVLALASCTTTEVEKPDRVDPALLERHESRLMKAYRAGNTVLCQRLVIDVNPLFFKHLTFPAGTPTKRTVDGVPEMVWSIQDGVSIRKLGKPIKAYAVLPKGEHKKRRDFEKFKILIGSTVFMVDDQVKVRSLLRAAPTLTALASGHVMVIQDGKNASTFQQVRYADGRVEAR